jgi:hypothetical protein
METGNVLERKYIVRTLIAALLSHHRLKLHVEMVDTGYRRNREYTGSAFLPHMASQKSVHGAHNFRAGVERSQIHSREAEVQNPKTRKTVPSRTFYKKGYQRSRYHTIILV